MSINNALPLRDAVHSAVAAYPGGPLAIAGVLRANSQVLRNRLNHSGVEAGHHLPLNHLEIVCDLTRDRRIADSVADLCGGVFVPLDGLPEVAGDSAVLDEVLGLVERVGELGRVVQQAIDDGTVDRGEWRDINAAKMGLMSTTQRLMLLLSHLRETDDE